MLDNLIYCLNATVPIFLMMLLGMLFRRMGFFDQAFADKLNSYVFKIGLPVMLFKDLVESNFFAVWDGPFVLYCFLATLLSILLTAAVSLFWKDRSLRGEFVQVGYRSSIALLGAAFLENLYGNAGAASLVIIGAVPLYNVAAVLVLSLSSPQQSGVNRAALKKACKGIVTNPIILGIVVGLVWTLLRIPEPLIMEKTVNSISATATPLGLMALGASFDLKKALVEMNNRGRSVPGGVCGFWGACGAAISTGMFVSIVTGSTPLAKEAWGLSNLMTSCALKRIGEIGGPRCCKRNSYAAVTEAVHFAEEHLGVRMELKEILCSHSGSNNQCIGKRCPYNKGRE